MPSSPSEAQEGLTLRRFAEWLVWLDDPEGSEDRRRVTLDSIIKAASQALAAASPSLSFSEEAIEAAAKALHSGFALGRAHDSRGWEALSENTRAVYRLDARAALSAAADIERESNSDP